MGKRRRFSAEFKREVVALTAQPDVSVARDEEVAKLKRELARVRRERDFLRRVTPGVRLWAELWALLYRSGGSQGVPRNPDGTKRETLRLLSSPCPLIACEASHFLR